MLLAGVAFAARLAGGWRCVPVDGTLSLWFHLAALGLRDAGPGLRLKEQQSGGRYWTRTSDLYDVNVAL